MFIDDKYIKELWDKMPEVSYNIKDLFYSYRLVFKYFNKDKIKTRLWFETENPMFGGVSAISLFRKGRGHKVVKFIEIQLSENGPEF